MKNHDSDFFIVLPSIVLPYRILGAEQYGCAVPMRPFRLAHGAAMASEEHPMGTYEESTVCDTFGGRNLLNANM